MGGTSVWSDSKVVDHLNKLVEQGMVLYDIVSGMKQEFPGSEFTEDMVRGKIRRMGLKGSIAAPEKTKAEMKKEQKEREQLEKKAARVETQLKGYIENHNAPVAEYFGSSYKFGVVSDLHLGSLYDRHDIIETAWGILKKEGVKEVFVPGDIHEGIRMYPGQEFEVEYHGADAQLQHSIDSWPEYKGMKSIVIGGNHDFSFVKHGNFDIVKAFGNARDDVEVVGQDEALVTVQVGKYPIKIMLSHPHGGSSYAISYRSQKFIESLPGGRKPHILLQGHYHKSDYLPCYRNVLAFQAGCLQSQTPHFMRPKGLAAHLGFWIIEVRTTKNGIARCKGEFIPFYEE